MAQQCSKALEQFSEEILDTIATDMTTTLGKYAVGWGVKREGFNLNFCMVRMCSA